MICKFCNQEISDDVLVCPQCGENLTEETPETEQMPEAEQTLEVEQTLVAEDCVVEEKTKKKRWLLIAVIGGCVLLVAAAVLAVLHFTGVLQPKTGNGTNYTVSDEMAAQTTGQVVATAGDQSLTNGELQIYYWSQVYDFLNYYGSNYFDITKPLNEQIMPEGDNITWQEYFLEAALNTWHRYQVLTKQANEDAEYTLDPQLESYLISLPLQLEDTASEYEFEDAESFIQADMGAGCTVEQYISYMSDYCNGMEYFDYLYEKIDPTMEDVEKYFTDNEEELKESGITKDSGLISNVRHILVKVEQPDTSGGELPSGNEEDNYWATCRQKAQQILDTWKNGDATEESFIELVTLYTEDTASIETGGLYENITPDSNYVPSFLKWATDSKRQPGDTDIVISDYGCHIMYFVSGEEQWISTVKTSMLADYATGRLDEGVEQNPMTVYYEKIALADALASLVASDAANSATQG